MAFGMNGDRQVHWGQGAFLSPQHLQAQDAWEQACRHALHLRLTPFPWGYEALRVREDALGSGVVDVEHFSLVTRTGERLVGGSVETAGGNTRVPQRNIAELRVAGNDPIPVWLVFNRERAIQGLSQRESERLQARHALATDTLADPFDPQAPEADVDFLLYQPNIVTGLDENAEAIVRSSDSYKFAELLPAGPGKFKLSHDYIPPTTAIVASHNLLRWTRALRDLLVSRGQDFASVKRQRGIRAASTSAQEVMRVVMMQTFGRHIPLFQEHARLNTVSAYAMYQDLRTLVAEFSVFSEDIGYFGELAGKPRETELPDYDHAETLIKALTVGAEVGITLTHDGRFYRADLPVNLFENDKTRFYLAFESEQKGAELFARLSRTGKIASMDEMPRLLSAALFGLKIDLLPVPPEELPQKSPNTTYFLVDTTHPFWQMIKNGRNIAVFSDLPADSTVIKLFPVATQDGRQD